MYYESSGSLHVSVIFEENHFNLMTKMKICFKLVSLEPDYYLENECVINTKLLHFLNEMKEINCLICRVQTHRKLLQTEYLKNPVKSLK